MMARIKRCFSRKNKRSPSKGRRRKIEIQRVDTRKGMFSPKGRNTSYSGGWRTLSDRDEDVPDNGIVPVNRERSTSPSRDIGNGVPKGDRLVPISRSVSPTARNTNALPSKNTENVPTSKKTGHVLSSKNTGNTVPVRIKTTSPGKNEPEKLEAMKIRHERELKSLEIQVDKLKQDLHRLLDHSPSNSGPTLGQLKTHGHSSRTHEIAVHSHASPTKHNEFYKDLEKRANAAFKAKNYCDALEGYFQLIGAEKMGHGNSGMLAFFWNNAAICWYQLGHADQALPAISKAIELKPQSAVQFYNRAGFYNKLGKYSKAIDDLKKTIELDPDNSGARTRLKEMEKRQKTDLEVVYF